MSFPRRMTGRTLVTSAAVIFIALVIAALLVLYFGFSAAEEFVIDTYENVTLLVSPSASLASTYGYRHFNASDAQNYDLGRAQYLYEMAARLDPTYPDVYDQLARIAFLHGDFSDALVLINEQIALHGESAPYSYYERGLIEGYMGDYAPAEQDFAEYLQLSPNNPYRWAGFNDYAWILLEAGDPQEAVSVTDEGLRSFPQNPWLLNTNATALFQTNNLQAALAAATLANTVAATIAPSTWLSAFPGNDPASAAQGILSFQQAAKSNYQIIEAAIASSSSVVQ